LRNLKKSNIIIEFIILIKKGRYRYMTTGCAVCCVCGEEHGLDEIHHIETKGKEKKICKECATAIKGII